MPPSPRRERFELSLGNFRRAQQRLHEVLNVAESDITRDALIQRFEFTYEMAWKSMLHALLDAGERVPEMVRPVIQAAFRAQWIDDPELWERIKDARNETSHTYNEAKAIEVADFVRRYAVQAFDALLQRLASLP
jgi:nucleotidyltransferase substrate binding protein (TIGR01987 family)